MRRHVPRIAAAIITLATTVLFYRQANTFAADSETNTWGAADPTWSPRYPAHRLLSGSAAPMSVIQTVGSGFDVFLDTMPVGGFNGYVNIQTDNTKAGRVNRAARAVARGGNLPVRQPHSPPCFRTALQGF